MLIRATIVLLAVLNLGVLAWWLWRPAPVQAAVEQPVGVPRLVLLEEIEPPPAAPSGPVAEEVRPAPVDTAEPADTEPATRETLPAAEPQRQEPSQDEPRASATRPQEDDRPLAGAPRCEGAADGDARGWRVYLPPAADLAAAEATARAIGEAGFGDYLVLRDGDSANGIALGMYSTEAAAQRRSAALRDKGFAARCARIPG